MRHVPAVLFAVLMLAWVALVILSAVDMEATVILFRLLGTLLPAAAEQ